MSHLVTDCTQIFEHEPESLFALKRNKRKTSAGKDRGNRTDKTTD